MAIDVAAELSDRTYEGPFDLLLQLILAEEVDIHEVSLARIVDAYLLIAATLVELKARRLLPGPASVDLDDELALWEERDLLLARLLECKTFKDVSQLFGVLADEAGRSFPRTVGADERFVGLAPDPLAGLTPLRIRDVAIRALTPKPPPRIDLFHVAPIRASVADAVAELVDELPRVGRITFARLTASLVERLDVIVRFLAVLELFKQGVVDLEQFESFGELTVRPLAAGERVALDLSSLEEWGDEPLVTAERSTEPATDTRIEEQV
jgi:segregation and condensation protein A